MIKKVLFFLLFILGCQQDWAYNDKQNFINQCIEENNFLQYDSLKYNEFCNCLLQNILTFKLSYNEFITKDLDTSELDEILKSCID